MKLNLIVSVLIYFISWITNAFEYMSNGIILKLIIYIYSDIVYMYK